MNRWLLTIGMVWSASCSGVKAPPAAPARVERAAAYSAATIVASGEHKPSLLAPGRIASIYGRQLGPDTPCTGSADPSRLHTPHRLRPNQTLVETQVFPDRLCETEVRVDGVAAGLLYVSEGQINFQMPQQSRLAGTAAVQVIYRKQAGPVAQVELGLDSVLPPVTEVAETMWRGLQAVRWQTPERGPTCVPAPANPTASQTGLHGHVYACSQQAQGVVAETFYYAADAAEPKVLLRRADFRLAEPYPEASAAVEQQLKERLTAAYGASQVPEGLLVEIGVTPKSALAWRAGDVTVFLHRNLSHVFPFGVRSGVQLIAVRREVLDERRESERVEAALQSSAQRAGELEKELGAAYFGPVKRPESETERTRWELKTHQALLGLLEGAAAGNRSHRAAMLVAADDLTVRLGSLLMVRTLINGSENLTEAAGTGRVRRELAAFGVRYGGVGHYSGDLEYDRSLLRRAWKEFPETRWGQRAFLMLQGQCSVPEGNCDGPNCFLALIEQGEKFLRSYPETPYRVEQLYNLALAHETWWALSRAEAQDVSAEGAKVDRASGDRARARSVELYEELWRMAPESPQGRAARLRLPRLKLGLKSGERSFFCFSC